LAKPQQRASDLTAGRLVMLATAVVGAGALMGYGFVKMREGRAVEDPVADAQPASAASDLVARAQAARTALDTAALQQLEPELAAAEAPDARLERVAVLATLALESSVRAAVSGDPKASQQASQYVSRARPLVDQLASELDPGFVLATRARLDLAGGEDVLARHPSVLLPDFRDRELQHAVLAEPLWHPGAGLVLDDSARTNLARALGTTSDPTTFERLFLALASPAPRAQSLARDVLKAAPSHALAQAILRHLEAGPAVAIAEPTEPAEPAPTEPAPADAVEVEPAEPAPTEPVPSDPVEPVPADTKADAAKPPPTGSGQPKKTPSQPKQPKQPKAPSDLAEEGCKLVHGGKAEQGFAMLQRAFDENPRDTKVILCMAEGHMKLDRMASARALVERVVRSSSKNKKALQLAAKIEDELGNERSAADYYRKLLELDPDNGTAKAYIEKHGG
jgi:tetratricopeptide (TPR) repeat protein